MDCTSYVTKTKALISLVATAKLICVFIFAYAKSQFSHNEAHIINNNCTHNGNYDFQENMSHCMTKLTNQLDVQGRHNHPKVASALSEQSWPWTQWVD